MEASWFKSGRRRGLLGELPVVVCLSLVRHKPGSSGAQTNRAAHARLQGLDCARRLIAGIETMHMIKKGQLDRLKGQAMSDADQFYSLAI